MAKKQNPLSAGGVRREFTASSDFLSVLLQQKPTYKPDTEIQSLMESAPGDAEIQDRDSLQELREAVADCIDMLDEIDVLIINGIYSECLTFQELADRLGYKSKSTITKRLDNARKELKEHMEKHPVIKEWLSIHE